MASLFQLPKCRPLPSVRVLVFSFAGVALTVMAPVIELSADATESNGRNAAVAAPRSSKREAARYGEVIERTVNDNGHGEYLIDLDTGKLYERPDDRRFDNEREFLAWARSEGIDAMGQVKSSYKGLAGFDMIVIPTDAESWDQRPGGVVENLEMGDAGTPANMDARAGLPATFFVQTREGARGILQITGVDEDNNRPGPDSVRLRFKPIAQATRRVIFRADESGKNRTHWNALHRFPEGSDQYMMMGQVEVGESFPVQLVGSDVALFKVELASGSDEALSVKVLLNDGDAQRLWLERDQPVDIVVGGEKYTLRYPTSEVAADSQAESPTATIMITWTPRNERRQRDAQKAIEFGESVERTLNDDNPERGDFLIDFESGEVFTPPLDLTDQQPIFAWVAARGIDAMGELNSSVQGLLGFDMIVLPTADSNWDPSPGIFAQVDDGKPGTPAVMSGRGELPVTYMFKTREGRRGVLQILERNGHDSVKIRYKLEKKR